MAGRRAVCRARIPVVLLQSLVTWSCFLLYSYAPNLTIETLERSVRSGRPGFRIILACAQNGFKGESVVDKSFPPADT